MTNNDSDALVDDLFYYLHNPDVAAAGFNPLDHYNTSGWKEGRDPSVNFDTSNYLSDNPRRRRRAHQSPGALPDVRHPQRTLDLRGRHLGT